ncbi:hipl1 protein [Quercus suber]|uniref:Hipl1 protein n=1 Tax=Quercus suber TaxID=58331 RepID=A0AAW0KN06_QUESU
MLMVVYFSIVHIMQTGTFMQIVLLMVCGRCNYTCSKENVKHLTRPASVPSPFDSTSSRLSNPLIELLLLEHLLAKDAACFLSIRSSVCCSSTDDIQLLNQFRAMNVSDLGCSSLLKSILRSFSAKLYRIDSTPQKVPVLCNSTVSANSTQSQLAEVDFCSKVWDE